MRRKLTVPMEMINEVLWNDHYEFKNGETPADWIYWLAYNLQILKENNDG